MNPASASVAGAKLRGKGRARYLADEADVDGFHTAQL